MSAQYIQLENYAVRFGPIESLLKDFLKGSNYSKIGVLVDELTKEYCLPQIITCIPKAFIIEIKSGEQNKSLPTCEYIWTILAQEQFDRHSLLINLGGGVIGDMGGFAASCYMRGIDFIQIPTTLLSQVDASVGGKLAIDFKGYKNFIGLFKDPSAVLIDPEFLNTLSFRELRSGYAEMIKHGLIMDKSIWNRFNLKEEWTELKWEEEIYESVMIKQKVVSEDPYESGLRKILNFGHTVGHAIETIALKSTSPLLHGEAIAFGMAVETTLSEELCGLSSVSSIQICHYLNKIYHDMDNSILLKHDEIISLMKSDKKNRKGNILISLLESPGKCKFDIEVDHNQIVDSLDRTYKVLNGQ